jgi:hypothetical protein
MEYQSFVIRIYTDELTETKLGVLLMDALKLEKIEVKKMTCVKCNSKLDLICSNMECENGV